MIIGLAHQQREPVFRIKIRLICPTPLVGVVILPLVWRYLPPCPGIISRTSCSHTIHHTPWATLSHGASLHTAPLHVLHPDHTIHHTPHTIHHIPYTTHHRLYCLMVLPSVLHHCMYCILTTPHTIHHTPYTTHHTPHPMGHTASWCFPPYCTIACTAS